MTNGERCSRALDELELSARGDAVRLRVHAKPRSSRSKLVGIRDGALSVALCAPPVNGEANAELVRLLARQLKVKRAAVSIVAGASGRHKIVEISGVPPSDLRQRLLALLK